MKLKDLIAVSSATVNIRLYDKERKGDYHMLGCEESFSANFDCRNCPELEKEYTKKQEEVLRKYGNWEVIDVWGFDNGLTVIIKESN